MSRAATTPGVTGTSGAAICALAPDTPASNPNRHDPDSAASKTSRHTPPNARFHIRRPPFQAVL